MGEKSELREMIAIERKFLTSLQVEDGAEKEREQLKVRRPLAIQIDKDLARLTLSREHYLSN